MLWGRYTKVREEDGRGLVHAARAGGAKEGGGGGEKRERGEGEDTSAAA